MRCQHLCELGLTVSTDNDRYGCSIIVVEVGKGDFAGATIYNSFTAHRIIFSEERDLPIRIRGSPQHHTNTSTYIQKK